MNNATRTASKFSIQPLKSGKFVLFIDGKLSGTYAKRSTASAKAFRLGATPKAW